MCEEDFKEWIQQLQECTEEDIGEFFEKEREVITNLLLRKYPWYLLEVPGFVNDALLQLWSNRKNLKIEE